MSKKTVRRSLNLTPEMRDLLAQLAAKHGREVRDEWYYAVVDVVMVLIDVTDKKAAQNYYHVLKGRLKREGNQSLTTCKRLKLVATDGKRYLTDVMTTEQVLRLMQSILAHRITAERCLGGSHATPGYIFYQR